MLCSKHHCSIMALVPNRQIYPTSFLNATPLLCFRYGCSISVKKLKSLSVTELNPLQRSDFACKKLVFRCNFRRGLCSSGSSNGGWIDMWNEQSNNSRPRLPRSVFNYRAGCSGGGADGGTGSTMEKIVEKLKKFGYVDGSGEESGKKGGRVIEKGSVEDIFYVEEGMLPDTRGGFSEESLFRSDGEARFPWEKKKEEEEGGLEKWSAKRKSRFSIAETTLPENELRRLRNLTFQTTKGKIKIGKAGVQQDVVDKIHEKWSTSEVVRIKVDGAPALNMKRMHEILEKKTGGLVIWRSGTSVSLYRGVSYRDPSLQMNQQTYKRKETPTSSSSNTISDEHIGDDSTVGSYDDIHEAQPNSGITAEEKEDTESLPEVNYEDEVDKLLDGLGPRYTDWAGCDPLPVDADLLPGIVPGYEPPFRLLPYGVRSTLGQKEATALRRLARVLPPHFALGRNRQLQGLAVAMAKLWENSKIAKVALKRGVQLTTSERMAEQLKKLTGGMLLSRNKDFLVFYRGKDFLSPDVTKALVERERLAISLQDEEEQARQRASAFVLPSVETAEQSKTVEESGTAGTLAETLDADARWGKKLDNLQKEKVMREAKIMRHASLVRKLEHKLALAEQKLMKAEEALSKVEESLQPAAGQADPEGITDEERFMFSKLGLRMKAFLLLGRRGVFDGTVENMHLHWRYRELVKIIVKAKNYEQVKKIALALEAESGGILVSVNKVSKGYAIIVYRGKDYKRPSMLRPKNLLTKRKALARSIELQRMEALLKHISSMESRVAQLRAELDQMETVKDEGDEVLYDRLDSDYLTEDEDSEDEQVDAILESSSENDTGIELENSDDTNTPETNFPYDDNNRYPLTNVPAPNQQGWKSFNVLRTSDEVVEDAELEKEEQTWIEQTRKGEVQERLF